MRGGRLEWVCMVSNWDWGLGGLVLGMRMSMVR